MTAFFAKCVLAGVALALLAASGSFTQNEPLADVRAVKQQERTTIVVDTHNVACSRFLGSGAEWDPKFWADYNLKLGVGEQDWKTVIRRIRWMKLPFVRMMLLTKWCLPKADGAFDWNAPEMKSLYRHLDVCQKEGVTVFLMDWGIGADWNKVSGLSGNDDPKYAEAIGTYLDYLIPA